MDLTKSEAMYRAKDALRQNVQTEHAATVNLVNEQHKAAVETLQVRERDRDRDRDRDLDRRDRRTNRRRRSRSESSDSGSSAGSTAARRRSQKDKKRRRISEHAQQFAALLAPAAMQHVGSNWLMPPQQGNLLHGPGGEGQQQQQMQKMCSSSFC